VIQPSTWELVSSHTGLKEQGTLMGEPFSTLAYHASASPNPARVTVNVGSGVDYNQVKVSVTINVVCPQREDFIQLAAESAFLKALEMVNEASATLGIPTLPKAY